jgi:long-chain acyl-CoA synthetase
VAAHLGAGGATIDDGNVAARALIQQRIDRVNAQLASYETIKRFAILARPLTVEGGMLTPTLKVRRKKVVQAFESEFESLYA